MTDEVEVMPERRREEIEREIRISIWNGAKWQGSPDEVALSLIRKIMTEPCMVRALDRLASQSRSFDIEAERDSLRSALIECGREIPGCVLHDDVPTDFLMLLPEEMRAFLKRFEGLRAALKETPNVG